MKTRQELEPIANSLRELKKQFFFFELAGSYRRGEAELGDLDVVCVTDDATPIINWYKKYGTLMYASGANFMSGNVKVPFGSFDKKGIAEGQVDFKIHSSEDEWSAALIHFTGSKEHNIYLRSRAKKYGFKLNEFGLWCADERVPGMANEACIFEALGMEFVPPEERK